MLCAACPLLRALLCGSLHVIDMYVICRRSDCGSTVMSEWQRIGGCVVIWGFVALDRCKGMRCLTAFLRCYCVHAFTADVRCIEPAGDLRYVFCRCEVAANR
jgi:hypothetical protein